MLWHLVLLPPTTQPMYNAHLPLSLPKHPAPIAMLAADEFSNSLFFFLKINEIYLTTKLMKMLYILCNQPRLPGTNTSKV